MISQRLLFMIVLLVFTLVSYACALLGNGGNVDSELGSNWQSDFDFSRCTLITTGSNPYFILEPGFQLVLEGGSEVLVISVMDETIEIDGIETRVVEEREWKDAELKEVSRNFFALCEENNDVYYFGEEVDVYASGEITGHVGAWRAGENDAQPGLMMAGDPVLGQRYYQEIAPGVAMDRAEIVSLSEELSTPAGNFQDCLKTKEDTTLNPLEVGYKTYAPGIGMIQDENLLLTSYGYIQSN